MIILTIWKAFDLFKPDSAYILVFMVSKGKEKVHVIAPENPPAKN